MQVNDALDAVLLGAFFFGLIVTGLAFALGIADLSVGHFGDIGHVGPHGHVPGHGRGIGRGSGRTVNSDLIQPINIGTLMAFVTWFGGVSYLVRNGLDWWAIIAVPIGILAGLLAGYFVFIILRALQSGERVLQAEDYRIEGVIGHLSSSIREGGTGEVIYEQRGVRQVSAAKSATGLPIARGSEVVIVRREHGVAFVEPWASFLGDRHADLAVEAEQPVEQLSTRE
jgi:membrane protein implicated in regulation of membrane protease activity